VCVCVISVLSFMNTDLLSYRYVLLTSGSKIAIGIGANIIFNDSTVVRRPLIVNGGSVSSPGMLFCYVVI
jgi:hypothetical protein